MTDAPSSWIPRTPRVLEQALRVYCGKAIVNSVNGEEETLNAILPLVKKYGAAVVGLTLDHTGIPKTVDARLGGPPHPGAGAGPGRPPGGCVHRLPDTHRLRRAGSRRPDPGGPAPGEGELGLKTVLGVSNISFGLPARPLVNQNFLTMAMAAGLDLPILNPNVDAMMAAVRCYHLLMNIDTDAREFIAAYGNATVSTSITSAAGMTAAPGSGEKRGLEEIVEARLKTGRRGRPPGPSWRVPGPLDVVDNVLIPALDRVGAAFEAGKVFLPQLIQSAGAAQAAFEVIRERLSGQPGQGARSGPGTIVLATVKGDIHDIGKNIVKVLLENYGYTVVDLGKDVDPAAVAGGGAEAPAPLVGLSALMTTTLKSMADTIALLHLEGLPCKIMVGGAVLTPEYASQIEDFYARDAKESVDIAKRVIG